MNENPFSILEIRLNRLESLLLEIKETQSRFSTETNIEALEPPIKMGEVCKLLQVSSTTVRSWMAKGVLPFHRKSSRIFFYKSEVLKSLEQPLKRRR